VADEQSSYRIGTDTAAERRERARLDALARVRDPRTFTLLERCGIAPGWCCLEVGAGSGSVSLWLAERVGPAGRVVSIDVDLRFHAPPPANVEVRAADVVHDSLPDGVDLVHARAVLQHIPEREAVLDRLVAALRPGGWIVVEDGDMRAFEAQALPEPMATVHRAMIEASKARLGWDPYLGSRLPDLLRTRGLVDIDIVGDTWAMRGGDDSGEWWFLALEHVADALPALSSVTRDDVAAALALARSPGFVMLGPLSIAVMGRRP
jgi:SAM-dependent methyltransferase